MCCRRPAREVLQEGARRDVVYAQAADGSRPAKTFYASLNNQDRMSFASLFELMAEHGAITNPEKFRSNIGKFCCQIGHVTRKGGIAEFKIHHGSGQRILAYRDGRQWVLVSGFPKGANLESEKNKACRIICDDLRRQNPPTK